MDSRACSLALTLSLLVAAPTAQTKLLRFPDLHADAVVFCHGGDLWRASVTGGVATRLTSHAGEELFPRFSPDGRWIAFTGQIDGEEQVYVIPAQGGVPRQLTFHPSFGPLPPRWGYDHQVQDWTPDGRVLFRSYDDTFNYGRGKLYTIGLDGGMPKALPMPVSGAGAMSPDGKQVVYSPLFRDFRTWKRYQGGWSQDLWVFNLQTFDSVNITQSPRTDRDPMWIGDAIYYTSDRTGTLNLFRYDTKTKATEQLTSSTTWDLRWPGGCADGRIAFEMGGELWIFDTNTRATTKLSIEVPSEDLVRRPGRVSAADRISTVLLSPKGERAVVAARGDIFTVPVENGPTRNLTRSSNAHDKHPAWSPDGAWIACVSDRSGEEQVWLLPQDGRGEPRQVTKGLAAMLYSPAWSADSKMIAFGDKDGVLRVADVASGTLTIVADDEHGQIFDYTWSPCGHHLAFSMTDANAFDSIWVWSRGDPQARRVTSELSHEFSPVWDPKGERLFALGYRNFAPRIGNIEWNFQVDRSTSVMAYALRKDLPAMFPPKSDEVTLEKPVFKTEEQPSSKESESKATSKPAEKTPLRIDFDGLEQRVERVPLDSDNYVGLGAIEGHLIMIRGTAFYYGRSSDKRPELVLFDLAKRERKSVAEGIAAWSSSEDNKKLVVAQDGSYFVMDAKPDGFASKKKLSTQDLYVERVPVDEWSQVFDEVWRRFRDFFYAPNMHGYDWDELRARYRMLLPNVAHRSDLNYLIGEMISELNAGHAYISGGDAWQPERPRYGMPGALFELDEVAGRYKIAKILRGENDSEKYRSPLTAVGVDAREGDYVLAIDGDDLAASDNPFRLLRHKVHPVRLTLNTKPSLEGAREVSYVPIENHRNLLYWQWVAENRRKVSELSNGTIGYLHVPDMGEDGIYEFIKWFYPQVRKQGLIIDDRYNGGGNVSQMLIERLRRQLMMVTYGRTTGIGTNPNVVFTGHMACLLNENSASDGDIFPATFRRAGLGPLVGKKSWGGIVGITNRGTLQDGGVVNVPEFANTEPEGRWTIEGEGVKPDFEVDNDPKSVLAGRDLQLEKAVSLVLAAIAKEPRGIPERPADPVRK